MKKLIFISLLFSTAIIFSQTKKIEPGIYVSKEKGQNIKLTINQDNTYDLSVFYGKFTVENDTIHFVDKHQNQSNFQVKLVKNPTYSSTLKVTFNDLMISYYGTSVYIGTQENENRPVEYKPFAAYEKQTGNNIDSTQYTIDVPKTKFLYLVDNYSGKNTISKFPIDNDVNQVNIDYDPYSLSNIKLKGYIDKNTNQLVISDGKMPLFFNFEKEASQIISDEIQPIEVVEDKEWLKKNNFNSDEASYNSTGEYPTTAQYNFKYADFKSFSEAQKQISKTPNKFLIVFFDNDKDSKKTFENFKKEQERVMSNYMYDAYNAEYDHFEYYLATAKDKNLLSKNKIKETQQILVYNSAGNLIYHTNKSINDCQDLFDIYGSFYSELQNANKILAFDSVINNSKVTAQETTLALKSAMSFDGQKEQNNYDIVVAPPKLNDYKEETVDSAAVAVDTAYATGYDYDYSIIKDKENLYSLKSSQEQVYKKWLSVIDYYSKNSVVNKDFISVLKGELSASGFSSKLYNKEEVLLSDTDFKLLDYVFKNYDAITKLENEPSTDEQDYYYESPIASILTTVFYNNTSSYYNPNNKNSEKIMSYYEKYIAISNNDFSVMQNYLAVLKENGQENSSKYISVYENFYDSVIKQNSNIIEDLDTIYSQKSNSNSLSWEEFKNSFSNTANDVAWYIVENSKDKTEIKKAINWSETSLKITKDNHYYLDTLAQLYYKNGERDKAITTEQKAIELVAQDEYSDQLEVYKEVLEKMKNGTY